MAGGIGGLPSFGPGDARPPRAIRQEVPRWPDRTSHRRARGPAGSRSSDPRGPGSRSGRASGSRCAGVGGLTSAELIGLIWGSGTRGRSAVDLAADALARHDGLTGLARATELELAEPSRDRRGQGGPAGGRLRARSPAAGGLAGGALDDPRPARRRRPADPPDGPARARGAAGRDARHEEPRPARRDRLPGQRLVVAGPGRRAVPRRGPAQRGRHHPRPQPPVGRPDAVTRTTST